jgi:serine/threonine protein kinase
MFLAMEWLEGEDLAQRLSRGRVGWQGARTLGLRLSAALDHAHRLGCIHRDLSPRNVFLPEGRLEQAKLLDFGLVRTPDTQLAQTATGAVLGTPFYMSPEQIRDPKSVTARSDLFGLGVLLYEAISGVRPFQGDDLFTLWVRIVDQQPADLRPFVGAVPESFIVLVESLLAKDPAMRPSSAGEVHHRLSTMSLGTSRPSTSVLTVPHATPLGVSGTMSAAPPTVLRAPVPMPSTRSGSKLVIGAAIFGVITLAFGISAVRIG